MANLALCLMIIGLLVCYPFLPSNAHHFSKTHPSPSIATAIRMPIQQGGRHGNSLSLNPEHSLGGAEKMYVDRIHPRQFNPIAVAEGFAAEVNRLQREMETGHGDKSPATAYKSCTVDGKIVLKCDFQVTETVHHEGDDGKYEDTSEIVGDFEITAELNAEKSAYYGGDWFDEDNNEDSDAYDDEDNYEDDDDEDNYEDDDDEDYYKKVRNRTPLKWTEHRGPPNRHTPPRSDMFTNTGESNKRGTQSPHGDTRVVQQTADKSPHTSMNLGIARPRPPNHADSSQVNVDPSEPAPITSRKTERLCLDTSDLQPPEVGSVRVFGDKKAQLAHSKSTSNTNFPPPHETTSVVPSMNNVESHHSESVPRELVCECGSLVCDDYRNSCKRLKQIPDRKRSSLHISYIKSRNAGTVHTIGGKDVQLAHAESTTSMILPTQRWKQVPDSKRSDLDDPSVSTPEAAHDDGVVPDQTFLTPKGEVPSPQQEPISPTPLSPTTDSSNPITDATSGPATEPASGKTHYIPPYWRNDSHEDPTSYGEGVAESKKHNPNNKNGTNTKSPHVSGVTFGNVLIPKKCTGTPKQRHQCESSRIAGIILYTLIGIFFTCILLLAFFKCCTGYRKRRDIAAWKKRRSSEKGNASTQPSSAADSLSSKPERQVEGVVIRPPMNVDGTDDWDFPKCENRRRWNIFSRNVSKVPERDLLSNIADSEQKRVPGRFSPIPQRRAPRIPTLKLPKSVFLTVRKVSGLGTEGIGASFKNKLQGKTTDISRVKWNSTV
ncbi:uncharacterized protein RCO7_08586 [Rhynchosporium graminicola]|uniref:Uncharacterized protein n=1 Tax=Rhynchosporium graminicola TaxID=2792576 RepID=A0A1E1JWY1_9HELO|nr:uncharacterized protein RCO7_08586 [Rhynchosporium commune]